MKVTHTQIICWAIKQLASERAIALERAEKAKAAGMADLQNAFVNEAAEANNAIGTLAQLYEIETGKPYAG